MNYEDELRKSNCMECKKELDTNDLTWVNDNYGIAWKKVCDNCYDKVEKEIRKNNYGDYLTDYELYGDDY